MKIIIAGGAGFLGTALTDRWKGKHAIVILKRKGPFRNYGNVAELFWDGKHAGAWAASLEGADLLLKLAGRSVNCRYTAANKEEILRSRIDSTLALGEALGACRNPPRVWMNSSSATIYPHASGSPRDESFTEFADDFSVRVCKAWEAAFQRNAAPRTRRIVLRTAIVLGRGGALPPLVRLAKAGLGGAQGSGSQMFSWIHIDDVAEIIEWLANRESAEGVFNISAPHAVCNAELMRAIRQCLGIAWGLPAPEWLLRTGALLIGTETELLLKSRWVLPGRLFAAGYRFRFGHLDEAMRDLLPGRTLIR